MEMDNTYKNEQKISELKGEILTHYYKSGKKKAKGKFISGKFEGKWLFYNENGVLIQEGNFRNHEKNGSWKRFNENGELVYHETFKEGKKLKAEKGK
jgi:antitoxin component YwqK of YwqJK toxin-antitoxin module